MWPARCKRWPSGYYKRETVDMTEYCKKCGRTLTRDDIGLYKRFVNRGATEFFCTSCLASHFHVSEELLQKKIAHFRAQGCTLFL